MNQPVFLEAVIANVAANQMRGPDDGRGLQNRTEKVLRIDELRFRVISEELLAGTITTSEFLTASVQIRIGNEPVTNGFVPIGAMTWPFGDFEFESAAKGATFYAARCARFSKPVYLAPGQSINVQVRHTSATAQRFIITAMCRPVDTSDLGFTPWFAFYQPPVHLDDGGNFEDTSTESDLVNPFGDEMEIERFIGRMFSEIVSPVEVDTFPTPNGEFGLAFDGVRIRMEDQEATQIVRDLTPFGIVFDFLRKSWVVNATLVAKGFYRVAVQSNLAPAIGPADVPVNMLIGMLGYRAVR